MKKYILFALFTVVTLACSFTATPVPTPTIIPTPVGYGVEFPFKLDPIKEWGESVYVTCEQNHEKTLLDSDRVRKLVEAGGKLNTTMSENDNLHYLWIGNVPLELFYEPALVDDPLGIYYEYWSTSYCVSGLEEDVNGWGAYIEVITKVIPAQ